MNSRSERYSSLSRAEHPTFDVDGYPTEKTEQTLTTWPWQDANGGLRYMAAAWHWPDFATEVLRPDEAAVVQAEPEDRFMRFATGGWSGNESLIAAWHDNHLCWACTWRLSAGGGLHIFRLMPNANEG